MRLKNVCQKTQEETAVAEQLECIQFDEQPTKTFPRPRSICIPKTQQKLLAVSLFRKKLQQKRGLKKGQYRSYYCL